MMLRKIQQNKKGAIELSIGTVVIIVIGMTMLILGLVLVKSIFSGATDSVGELNTKVRGQIAKLFTEDQSTGVTVFLGGDKTARIKPSADSFGIAIGAEDPDGAALEDTDTLTYQLKVRESSDPKSCLKVLGNGDPEKMYTKIFKDREAFEGFAAFDKIDGSVATALIFLSVPKGTPVCSQKIEVKVKKASDNDKVVGVDTFNIEIQKGGLFG